MQGVRDIFGIWANLREMADDIGEKPNTVRKWNRRGRIPEAAWEAIIAKAALKRTLLTVEDFMRLNKPMAPRGAASPKHPNHREVA